MDPIVERMLSNRRILETNLEETGRSGCQICLINKERLEHIKEEITRLKRVRQENSTEMNSIVLLDLMTQLLRKIREKKIMYRVIREEYISKHLE